VQLLARNKLETTKQTTHKAYVKLSSSLEQWTTRAAWWAGRDLTLVMNRLAGYRRKSGTVESILLSFKVY